MKRIAYSKGTTVWMKVKLVKVCIYLCTTAQRELATAALLHPTVTLLLNWLWVSVGQTYLKNDWQLHGDRTVNSRSRLVKFITAESRTNSGIQWKQKYSVCCRNWRKGPSLLVQGPTKTLHTHTWLPTKPSTENLRTNLSRWSPFIFLQLMYMLHQFICKLY